MTPPKDDVTPQPGDMKLAQLVVGSLHWNDTPLVVKVCQAIARARVAGFRDALEKAANLVSAQSQRYRTSEIVAAIRSLPADATEGT